MIPVLLIIQAFQITAHSRPKIALDVAAQHGMIERRLAGPEPLASQLEDSSTLLKERVTIQVCRKNCNLAVHAILVNGG